MAAPFRPEQEFETAARRAIREALDLEPEAFPITYPPRPDLGDLASPVCFELARVARKAPRQLAEAIAAAFVPAGSIRRLEVAGGGYLNAWFDRPALFRRLIADGIGSGPGPAGAKVIVEHTNINPNKAAHIGHLRNAVLGDTLVRFLRRLGRRVEVQNYIDDTGVQLCDLLVGFLVLGDRSPQEVLDELAPERLAETGRRFDVLAWDLYAEVGRFYAADEANLRHRKKIVHAVESGEGEIAALGAHVSRRMVQHHLATMRRIDVEYDLLPKESDILALRFWDQAFERLRDSGAIHRPDAGKNAGCWVMDLPGVEGGAGEDQKIIVRSDGSVTYVGKDIAYQMWKFGLLGRDFRYAPFDWAPMEPLYPVWSTHAGEDAPGRPAFGDGGLVYNVIDTRQSYLQRVVAAGLRSLGHDAEADRSIHFAYEMVALTPSAVTALFPDYALSDEERGKAYLEMSGRKGLGVRADDLLDALESRSADEVARRNPDMPEAQRAATARDIAVGALRYYMLRYSRNRVVAFDLDDALAFEGETGPYLQYSVVRARNILNKVEAEGAGPTSAAQLAEVADLEALPEEARDDHWQLAQAVLRVEPVLRQAVDALELSTAAKHAYVLAQAFNSFYHKYPVAQEPDARARAARVGLVRLVHDGMVSLLGWMGIRVPDRM